MNDVDLVDTTLRDGEQAPGVSFSPQDRRVIAVALAAVGVREIELPLPTVAGGDGAAIRALARLDLPCRLSVWCRARPEDLEAAAGCGATGTHVSIPVSPVLLDSLGMPWSLALTRLRTCISLARRRGFEHVSVGAQDASRAPRERLVALASMVRECGAHRLRIADTVGIWDPVRTFDSVRALVGVAGDLKIGFHGHDDLGMATANSISAWRAGARSIDVTVNGLGERAGNAALEEVVMALRVSLDAGEGLAPEGLTELCRYVSLASGRTLAADKAIVGDEVFTHESGIHVRSLIADRRSYEPFDPAAVGRAPGRFVYGLHSGRAAIRHVARRAGVELGRSELERLLEVVRRRSRRLRRALTESEVIDLLPSPPMADSGRARVPGAPGATLEHGLH